MLDWPLREALLSYEDHLRTIARSDYQFDLLRYAMTASKNSTPPELPPILKD